MREAARIWNETDIRDVLPAVHVPTLIIAFEGDDVDREQAAHVASLMPAAELVVLPGREAEAPPASWVEPITAFLGVDRPVSLDRVLASVLFTDIVDSTPRAAALGDSAWRSLLAHHDEIAKRMLERFGGRYVHTTGDGMLAVFDGPARAVHCARETIDAVRGLGLEIRAGVHTGEVELTDDDVQGLAVHIGARVAAMAGPSEVWTSSTVKDLTAGSGLTFEDAGEHELKGVPDRWRLYRVAG
jgi:class 3 adenylate cyclase